MNPLSPLLKPLALHVPDGLLSLPISIIFWAISIILILIASRRTKNELGERQIPLMGIMAAFIFAAQMINFPIAGGTSGHLMGGVLAAITLGPWAAILVMTSVIAVQALLFQDGGLLVMGANMFNMGFLPVMIGYGLYRGVATMSRGVRLTVAGVAAWLSVIAGALAASLQLWLSGTALITIVVPAMLGVHALIGIGEALITIAAVGFILKVRPDLITAQRVQPREGLGWVIGGLVISAIVILFAPLASANPDGFERVAMNLGFLERGIETPYEIFPDYTIPVLGETALSIILSGIIGVVVVAAVTIMLVRLIRRPVKAESQNQINQT
jgi:cobalt/nickel transport system permease protein